MSTQLQELTEKAQLVIENYKIQYPEVEMDRDYIPLKITEEWGECLQTYLMKTDRGRQKGKSKEEIRAMLAEEFADVFAYLLVFAADEEVDLADAFEKKWMSYLS